MPRLMITGGPNTTSLWQPLSEKYELAFMYPQAAQQAEGMGIKAKSLVNYLTQDIRERADSAAVKVAARVVNALPDIQQRIHDVIPVPVVALDGNLPDWFPGFSHMHVRERITQIEALRAYFAEEKPVGFVTHEDVTPECRTMVMFCKARGVPTIHIPHASCHITDAKDIHREVTADWIAAGGQYEADWYGENGAKNIRIVGSPGLDWIYEPNALPTREQARRTLKIDGFAICYASTWAQTTSLRGGFGEELSTGVSAVLNLAKRRGARLMVRVHRSEPQGIESQYVDMMKQAGVAGLVTRSHGEYLLRAADVLIAQGPSNTCVDAAIMGIPSCYIQTDGAEFRHRLPPRCKPEGLEAAMDAALEIHDWTDFIPYYNDAHPLGNATDRAVAMIEEICL